MPMNFKKGDLVQFNSNNVEDHSLVLRAGWKWYHIVYTGYIVKKGHKGFSYFQSNPKIHKLITGIFRGEI